jgi:hypothetical protein
MSCVQGLCVAKDHSVFEFETYDDGFIWVFMQPK